MFLGRSNQEQRDPTSNVFNIWSILSQVYKPLICYVECQSKITLQSFLYSERTRGNAPKLRERRCRLEVRKKIFPVSIVRHWNRWPRKVVESLEIFKVYLDLAAGDVGQWFRGYSCSAEWDG